MEPGQSQTPQFATAEYSSNTSAMKCAACRQPISGSYFQIKAAPVCSACTERLRAQIPQDSHAAFMRALLFGIGGAVVGFALYVTFALATGLIIGWVSVAVGYIVGKAMHMGSRGVGGRRYQVVAVLLTYFAVSMSAVPIAIEQIRLHHRDQAQETAQPQPVAPVSPARTVAVLAWVGIASPILDLQDPVHGLIGLVILFVGLRFAWQFTAGRNLNVSGPYTAVPARAT
jgi:uncharacterized protein (DUF983 family)